jgi:hypothetical protein
VELEADGDDEADYRLELKSNEEEPDNRLELDLWRSNRLIAAAASRQICGGPHA